MNSQKVSVMLNSSSKIAHYYKNVIKYSDLAEVIIPTDPTGNYPRGGYPIAESQISFGEIDRTTVSKFFQNQKDNVVDVTIALDAFKYGKSFRAAMWVSASLKRDGTLNISQFPSFSVSKSYLEPFVNNISVGSSWHDFVAVQDSYRLSDVDDWNSYIQTIFAIKAELIKEIAIDFRGTKVEVKEKKNYIFKGNMIAKLNTNILSVYEECAKYEIASVLSEKSAKAALGNGGKIKEARITLTPKLSGALSTSKFIPNFEQWKSIETVLKSKNGQLTAVHGPPGTGKTSLLQFVIASEIVNSVCNAASRPTLTTICSTNNQAVTNAVKSLDLNAEDRWIKTEVGLGLYIPASAEGVSIPNITLNKSPKSNKVYVNGDLLEPFLQWDQFSYIKKKFIDTAHENLDLKANASLEDIAGKLKKNVQSYQLRVRISSYKTKIKSIFKKGILSFLGRNDFNYYTALKEGDWDKRLRMMKSAFADALHYWEARFLEEIEAQFIHQGRNKKLAFQSSRHAIETLSMLTPFVGMTLHQLAKHFGGINNPQAAIGSIGLLILDEAGQICPETGFFSLMLAKKALIVGDSMQLEPIHAISEKEDVRIAKGIHIQNAFKSSQGNFMDLADASADYNICLLEHYRCHPDIISISNELCYEDKLIPQTNADHGLYPPLSFLDVYGVCQRDSSGSLRNNDESNTIIAWIVHEKQKIETYYEKTIGQVIAVVTPFKKQADNIRIGLEEKGIHGVVVGTVHKLQGAEFPIVVFAPTYSIEYVRSSLEKKGHLMFFDVSPRMINVAVSRAQKSFIYMGDPRILNYGNENELLPSQILSNHLKAKAVGLSHVSKDNAFTKIEADIERISSLEAHREILEQAFSDAQDCVVISSPFITQSAIKEDNITAQIKRAVDRGVSVKIFYDSKLNTGRRHELKDSLKLLSDAGAEVIHKARLHSKVLYIDNKMIIESSFNWLSAVRDQSSDYQRYESSLLYRGTMAAKMIADVQKEFLNNS